MDTNNPIAWRDWAATQDPGLYGWQKGGINADSLEGFRSLLQRAGLWKDEYAGTTPVFDTETGSFVYPKKANADALNGYQVGTARSLGNTMVQGLWDPQGNLLSQDVIANETGSALKRGDWATIASILAGGFTAGVGGLAGPTAGMTSIGSTLSGGALTGAGATALGGATIGAGVGGIRDGWQGAAVGGLLGGAGGYYSGGGLNGLLDGGQQIDPAAMAGDYTNQMDLSSDAFSRGVDPAAFSGGYTNQMDMSSDAYQSPSASIGIQPDNFGGDGVQQIEVNGVRDPIRQLGTISPGSPPAEGLGPTAPPFQMPQSPAVPALGAAVASGLLDNIPVKQIVGAGLGALASSQDQTQETKNEPWAPAQGWIKSNIAQGEALQQQYQQQPFSPTQQAAYNNFGGLLNSINSGFGGLLSGMGANASGANQFSRNNPRAPIKGGMLDMSSFQPQTMPLFPRG